MISSVIQIDTEIKVCQNRLGALSSEVHKENIQYCNDLKPANNHVGDKQQF